MSRRLLTSCALLLPLAGCSGEDTTTVGQSPTPAEYSLALVAPTKIMSGSFDIEGIPNPEAVTLEVEFFLDGQSLGRDITPPYRFTITPSQTIVDGDHDLRAVALHIGGQKAEASTKIRTDNTAPDISLASPTEGQRVLASGNVPIRFDLQGDPSELSSLTAHFDGLPPKQMALPLLKGTIDSPPEKVFPVSRSLSWEAVDEAGNARTGSTNVTLSHVRFDLPSSEDQGFLEFGEHETLIGTGTALRAYDGQGAISWILPAPVDSYFAQVHSDDTGDVRAVLGKAGVQYSAYSVAKIGADGSLAGRYPTSFDSHALYSVTFERKTGSFFASRITLPPSGVQTGSLVEIDAMGTPKELCTLTTNRVALDVRLSRDTNPPVIAALTYDTTGAGPNRIEVFSRAGAPLWQTDIVDPTGSYAGYLALTADRVAILHWRVWPDCLEVRGISSSGDSWLYGGDCIGQVRPLPGGDMLILPVFGKLTRLRTDGTIAWARAKSDWVHDSDAGILVASHNPDEVQFLDHDGNTKQTFYPPQDLESSLTAIQAVPIASGGFYVVRTRYGNGAILPKASVWRVDAESNATWREDIEGVHATQRLLVGRDDDLLAKFQQPSEMFGPDPERFYRLVP